MSLNKEILKVIGICSLFVCCFLMGTANGQSITSYPIPMPTSSKKDPEDLQKLKWHREITENFVILSLDPNQGEHLRANVESIKTWCLTRWGLQDISFPNRIHHDKVGLEPGCIVVCVPTKAALQELIGIDQSHTQILYDDNSTIVSTQMWVVLDGDVKDSIAPGLTIACLREFEEQKKCNIPFWAERGITVLNNSPSKIKGFLTYGTTEPSPERAVDILVATGQKEWMALDTEGKLNFDAKSSAFTLLLRREFGQNKLHEFMFVNSFNDKDVYGVLGFSNASELAKKFSLYSHYLSEDIVGKKTPDEYLDVTPVLDY